MPNWVLNKVIGLDETALRKALVNDDERVDFNKLIKQPKDLDIECGSYSYNPKTLENDLNGSKITQLLNDYYNDEITQAEYAEKVKADERIKLIKDLIGPTSTNFNRTEDLSYLDTFVKGFFNVQRYGITDWYDWRLQHWGCKWNASETVIDDDGAIHFQTPWAKPVEIYHELCKVTPIRVMYADEDIGYNCGIIDYTYDEETDSVIEETVSDSEEVAYYMWNYFPGDDEDDDENTRDEDYVEEVNETMDDLMTPLTFHKSFL